MRILIITQGRSGGLSLTQWIRMEKNYWFYHDPDLNDVSLVLKLKTENNIVVKLILSNKQNQNFIIENFHLFDKVILHIREDKRDVAISELKASENFERNNRTHHKIYQVDDEWIKINKSEIELQTKRLIDIENDFIKRIPNTYLKTTYQNIFYEKSDVENICEFLEINEPIWLDILENYRRLRNGNIGMDNFIIKKRKKFLI